MKFSDYKISQAIKTQLDFLGYRRPTDIQFKVIKPILDGEDVMAISPTGSGKTAAFVIPTLSVIQKAKKDNNMISCLVMVPTRELAKQIESVYVEIGKDTNVKVFGLYGGVDQLNQINALKNGVDILVTTPGRMFDLISQNIINISKIKFLILDEADLMLDFGFLKDIKDVMSFIPRKRQTLFFSATISKKIKSLAYNVVRNPIRIQISPKNKIAKTIGHFFIKVKMYDKRFFLENMIKEYPQKKFIVFVRTQIRAKRVLEALKRVEIDSECLHGSIEQTERFLILNRFRIGENKVLITTDISARGIDIPDVEYVINYDIPDIPENYVHRCGRTGRGNKRGQAISFCSQIEQELLSLIIGHIGEEIEEYKVNKDEYFGIIDSSDCGGQDWRKLLKKYNEESINKLEW